MADKPARQTRRYRSYLLRLWQEGGGGPSPWRASLESPDSAARLGFASLLDLFIFLERETESSSPGLDSHESDRE